MADAYLGRESSVFEGYELTEDQRSALKAHISGKITTEEAVSRLVQYPDASPDADELETRINSLWSLLNDTAVNLEFAQPQIINILKHIRTLPRRLGPTGKGEEFIDLDGGFYWRELYVWAVDWADNFNHWSADFFIEACPSQEERAARAVRWSSACKYSARLVSAGDELLFLGASLHFATEAILKGLETDVTEQEYSEIFVDTAAQLFKYASSELLRRCKEQESSDFTTHSSGLWRGQDGYSMDRWQFWKDRWNSLVEQEATSPNVNNLARESLRYMGQAEG